MRRDRNVAGFNQRPGGRVDMVLDDLQAVQNVDWPWAPAVKAILGPSSSTELCRVRGGPAGRRDAELAHRRVHSVEEYTLGRTGSSCFVL